MKKDKSADQQIAKIKTISRTGYILSVIFGILSFASCLYFISLGGSIISVAGTIGTFIGSYWCLQNILYFKKILNNV
jgi:hypothetical protein